MEKYNYTRSKSTREGVMQQPSNMQDLRSYSTSYNPPPEDLDNNNNNNKEVVKIKKLGNSKSSRISASSSSKNWNFNITDPELQRKKRVAGYKAYAVEGKMKGSLRKSFRWIKNTCNQVVHGFW